MLCDKHQLFSCKQWYNAFLSKVRNYPFQAWCCHFLLPLFFPHPPPLQNHMSVFRLIWYWSFFTCTLSSRLQKKKYEHLMKANISRAPLTCVPKLAAIMWVRSLAANMEYLAQKIWESTARQRPVGTKMPMCDFIIHEQTIAQQKASGQLST